MFFKSWKKLLFQFYKAFFSGLSGVFMYDELKIPALQFLKGTLHILTY